MTFFERFEADILSGKKTITLRDEAEKDYQVNSLVQVSTYEDNRWFCTIKIMSVIPIAFDQLSTLHAQQENMSLCALKALIQEIYPGISTLYLITYVLQPFTKGENAFLSET